MSATMLIQQLLLVMACVLLAACDTDNIVAPQNGDSESEYAEEADGFDNGTECSTGCSVDEDCRAYMRKYCPDPVYDYYRGLCIGGILYECKTRMESSCCEGLDKAFSATGTCGEQSKWCVANAPPPDSNWQSLDGDDEMTR